MRPKDPLLISTSDAADTLGVGMTKLFELIAAREVETVLLGRRRMVVYSTIPAYVERLREQNQHAEAA